MILQKKSCTTLLCHKFNLYKCQVCTNIEYFWNKEKQKI